MFILHLKEVEIDPRINEEKTFENDDEILLEREAVDYVTKNYSGMHENPRTVERKIREAIRDDQGLTMKDRVKKSAEEFEKSIDEANQLWRQAEAVVDKEMQPRFDELHEWNKKESDRIWDEYNPKIEKATDEAERENLNEEMKLKMDDIGFEFDKRFDALSRERQEKLKLYNS